MPKSYSQDVRDRVIDAVERGEMSRRAAARRYGISESVAIKWLERVERDGSREPWATGDPQRRGVARVCFEIIAGPQSDRAGLRQVQNRAAKGGSAKLRSRIPSLRSDPHSIPTRRMRPIHQERRLCVNPKAGSSRQKFTPAACRSRGGTRLHSNKLVQARKNFKGLFDWRDFHMQ